MEINGRTVSWDRETGFNISGTSQEEDTQVTPEAPAVETPTRRAARRPERTQRETPFDGELSQSDLLETDRLSTIRDYMIRRKGTQYRDMNAEEVVDDFVEHMRFFNTNTVSTVGEVQFINKATDEDKQVANQAYQLYDQLGSVFSNDGFYGAVEGVGEYMQAVVSDPSNYVGLLTGGLGRVAAGGVTAGGRALVRQAMREAGERALASGATREAAEQAGREAGERVIRRIAHRNVTSETGDRLASAAANRAREQAMRQAQRRAERGVMAPRIAAADKASLLGTTAIDSSFAALQDVGIQNIMLDVGAQEEYSRLQTGFSAFLGGVGGTFQLAGRQLKGVSGLGDGAERLEGARLRAEEQFDIDTALDEDGVQEVVTLIDDTLSSWEEKVARGRAEFGEQNAPVEFMYELMLGEDGQGGLAGMLRDQGIRVTRNRTISDVMTNVIKQLPEEELIKINNKLEPITGIKLGETAELGQRLGDLLAKDINRAGRVLNVMSQVRKTINAAGIHSRNMMDDAARAYEDEINKELTQLRTARNLGGYTQSVWRRLLVSSPATSMINVAGFSQFAVGQSVADLFNAGTYGLIGLSRGGNMTAAGREYLKQARVYSTIQAQKIRNFADPFTTRETYLALLDESDELYDRLFESFAGGVDRNAARYNLDPNARGVQLTEKLVRGANVATGVTIQDSMTKAQMFLGELDKNLRLVKGKSLDEIMDTGVLDDIFDDDVINPALDTTLKSVFSKDYTTGEQMPLMSSIAKIAENISNTPILGTVLPFGRFVGNVVGTIYQWGPVSLIPSAVRVMRKSASKGEKLTAQEAFARAAVGTAAWYAAYQHDQKKYEEGLAYNEERLSDGTIIDVRNTFPYSYFAAIGRVVNLTVRGESIPEDLTEEVLAQMAVGQAASDLQFGDDMKAAFDAAFSAFDASDENLVNLGKTALRGLGNYTAGFTRPVDAINRLTGFINDTDQARDLRQADGLNLYTQASTRYLDNIFEALIGRVEAVSGEELRVATREGAVYDANPLAKVLGLTVMPARTSTERAYSMANLLTYKAGERSRDPAYDRILNESIAAPLERVMDNLVRDERYINGDTNTRKIMLESRLRSLQSDMRAAIDAGGMGPEGEIMALRRTARRAGNAQKRELAMRAMEENLGFDGGIEDMNVREMMYFMDYIDYLEYALEDQ
jgi:hypothetical protein